MGSGRTEFELKFTGAPADMAALPGSDFFMALAPDGGAWERLSSAYYDTADGALAARGLSIRLREEASGLIQAVKAKGAGPARQEYEVRLSSRDDFPAPIGDDAIDGFIREAAPGLIPIASTVVDRWAAEIDFQGARLEIAVDLGRAESRDGEGRDHAGPMAELELELLDGDPAAVFAFARLIADRAPLRLSLSTKLDGALALQRSPAVIPKEPRPCVTNDMSAGDVLTAALLSSAARIADLQSYVVDMRLPEGVHQMRVALRRLRATERTFRKHLKGEGLRDLAARARLFARALGPAREYDVFIGETLADAATNSGDPALLQPLKARAEAIRAAHWAQAVKVIAGREFQRFLLDLAEAGAFESWRKETRKALDKPAENFAARALDKSLKRARKAAARAKGGEADARHALRIALKKLRYAAQLFRGLYAKEARKDYMAALSDLQERLGAANDASAAQALADEAARGGGPEAQRAAGFVAGYKGAQAQIGAEEIDAALAAFENTPPFWNKA